MIRAAAVVLALLIAPSVRAEIYFGSLHGHTGYSDGAGTPQEVFAWALGNGFDFYAITDHGELLTTAEWNAIGTQAANANVDHAFVALRGFEYSNPIQGHACVWNTPTYTSALLQPTLDGFYRWLDGRGAYYASFNHPGDPAGAFRFLQYAKNVGDNFVAIETGNGWDSNGGDDYYGWYLTALGNGWKVAPVYAQDNHSIATPASPGRTAVHATELTRDGILEALRARRVYSTDDPDLRITFNARPARGDPMPMGSTVAKGRVTFEVSVSDDEPIRSLELITTGGSVLYADTGLVPDPPDHQWSVSHNARSGQWVFLRVVVEDGSAAGKVAVTAPIWFR